MHFSFGFVRFLWYVIFCFSSRVAVFIVWGTLRTYIIMTLDDPIAELMNHRVPSYKDRNAVRVPVAGAAKRKRPDLSNIDGDVSSTCGLQTSFYHKNLIHIKNTGGYIYIVVSGEAASTFKAVFSRFYPDFADKGDAQKSFNFRYMATMKLNAAAHVLTFQFANEVIDFDRDNCPASDKADMLKACFNVIRGTGVPLKEFTIMVGDNVPAWVSDFIATLRLETGVIVPDVLADLMAAHVDLTPKTSIGVEILPKRAGQQAVLITNAFRFKQF